MLEACLPLGPWVTSKLTFWPSLSVLKPFIWIAEKCANRSSLPSSGVMKPYPFASLNHFTVPIAIHPFPWKKSGPDTRRSFEFQVRVIGKTGAAVCLKPNTNPLCRLFILGSQVGKTRASDCCNAVLREAPDPRRHEFCTCIFRGYPQN